MSFKRKNTKPTRVPEPMLRYDPMQDSMVQHGALHTGLTNNELCLPPDIHVPNFHPTPPGMKSDSFHHPSLNMLRAAALFPNGQHFSPAITSPCVPEAETMYLGQPPMLHSSNDQHLQGCGTPWQVSLSLGNNSMDPPTMVAPNSRWQTEVSSSRSLNQAHHINAPSRNHPGKWSLSPQPENIEPSDQLATKPSSQPSASLLPPNSHTQDHISPLGVDKEEAQKKSRKIKFRYHDKQNTDAKYKCETCHYCTNRSDHYKRHLITHSEDKPLKCGTCGYSTGRSDHYRRHLMRHGLNKDEIHAQCEMNGIKTAPISFTRDPKSSKRQPRVKPISHKVTTPNNVNPVGVSNSTLAKRFSCQICGYSTDRSSHYNRHTRTHSDERPFSCDACGKRFKIDTYLKKHRCSMRQLHPDNMALQNSHEIDAQNIETLKQPLSSHLNAHPQICMTCGLWLPDRMECSNHICQGPMPVLGSM